MGIRPKHFGNKVFEVPYRVVLDHTFSSGHDAFDNNQSIHLLFPTPENRYDIHSPCNYLSQTIYDLDTVQKIVELFWVDVPIKQGRHRFLSLHWDIDPNAYPIDPGRSPSNPNGH